MFHLYLAVIVGPLHHALLRFVLEDLERGQDGVVVVLVGENGAAQLAVEGQAARGTFHVGVKTRTQNLKVTNMGEKTSG